MEIREVMRSGVIHVTEQTPAKEAYEVMRSGDFRHLPVVNAEDKLVGILSDRDIRNVAVLFEKRPRTPDGYMIMETVKTGDIMTRSPLTVAPQDDVGCAVQMMTENRISCLPVLDRDRLVGIVTEQDLLLLLTRLLREREKQQR